MNPVKNFLQKIDKLLSIVGSEVDNIEGLKINLLASVYLDLITKIGLDPQNKPFLNQMASNTPKTIEEFNRSIAFAQEKLKETSFDIEKSMSESFKSVLESFISKIEPNLTPKKVVELRKIVAESL